MDKRNQGRFCIQFNATDARHLQVVDVLESQGRRKAQFITEAVLHYINCNETPDIKVQQDPAMFKKTVEAIVREILKKDATPARSDARTEETLPPLMEMDPNDEANFPFDSGGEIDEDLLASIRESMSTMREDGE